MDECQLTRDELEEYKAAVSDGLAVAELLEFVRVVHRLMSTMRGSGDDVAVAACLEELEEFMSASRVVGAAEMLAIDEEHRPPPPFIVRRPGPTDS